MTVDLKRNMKITIHTDGQNRFNISDDKGIERLSLSDDFHIYFRDVEYFFAGYATAIYLGETDGMLIDGYCRHVEFHKDIGWITEDGQMLIQAGLVSIRNNQSQGMVVINK